MRYSFGWIQRVIAITLLISILSFLIQPATMTASEQQERLSLSKDIEYLQHNGQVGLLAAPNDPFFTKQNYLQQIHAPKAWNIYSESPSVVVALIDTGVDLNHPDLKDNLINGVNLIEPNSPPQDDHGHGTNVAGVVAAVGSNMMGVTGVSWNAKIMPIKALEANGQGDENNLGEGIRYAVDHGAKIIVMSVGLNRYSPFLQELVDYAEQKNVLLISATGNEGKQVKYPAAYPTVLAVGGVGPDNRVMLESNFGPEVDLVAPWLVYTTALGGYYKYNQGTSMAAPQVAGAAALIWAKYPEMQAFEIRNLLRQSAQDIESKGWDIYSGYGLLRVDRALSETYLADMYEPNDKRIDAKQLPLDTIINGELSSGKDQDWFFIEPKYKGNVLLTMSAVITSQYPLPNVKLIHYLGDGSKGVEYTDILRTPPVIPVHTSRSRWMIQYTDSEVSSVFRYKLKAEFEIYRDAFEDNDRQFKAYTIPPGQQSLNGTFHQMNDQDWFLINVEKSGSLQLSITPDSMRMDVAILIQKNGEKPLLVDRNSEGGNETIDAYDVTPGRYYILISNVISDNANPVRGEYTLKWQITSKLIDPNEPNNKPYQAANMVMNTTYFGLIDQSTDIDWFTFTLTSNSYIQLRLRDIPSDKLMMMTLYDSKQTQLQLNINSQGETALKMTQVLSKGTYYIKLGANNPFFDQLYRFDVRADEMIANFYDIKGHWAEQTIARMVKNGYVKGYGDFTFRPDRTVTRAEAVAMLVKALGISGSTQTSFSDVRSGHWASDAIQAAIKTDIISGYANGTFRPDSPITRAEMVALIARGIGLKESVDKTSPFADVERDHWMAGWLEQLRRENIIIGYTDGTFKPDKKATRAEMISIVALIIIQMQDES